MIGGFIQETPGREWREDVKGEKAGCCHETQPESDSMASWAETGTSALLTVTESTLSPITLSLCHTTEWGAEFTYALEEPFLSTIHMFLRTFLETLWAASKSPPRDLGESLTVPDSESSADFPWGPVFCTVRLYVFLYTYSSCCGKFYSLPWDICRLPQEMVSFIPSKI